MDLSLYPRPPSDTGWGFHDSAGAVCRPADPAAFARYLRQDLGIAWFKALALGTNKVDLARTFIQQGIEVVVRLYAGEPHPHYVVTEAEVRAYVGAGVHYFEWGNEPNLVDEWVEERWYEGFPAGQKRTPWYEGQQPALLADQWLRNAEIIREAGGIPLLPALSPGGHYNHRRFLQAFLTSLRARGHLASIKGAAVAVHNRPLAPYMTSEYGWIDNLVRSYLGHSLPLLGTEAGWEPAWVDNDLQQHAALNIDWLRGARQGRWRDCLFCECLWLVDNFGHGDFGEAAWHNNGRYGGDLPAVAALRHEWQHNRFARRFYWQEEPVTPTPATDPAIVRRRFTPAEFAQYVASLALVEPFSRVVIHHTAVPNLQRWLQYDSEHWLGNETTMGQLERTYRGRGWDRFPHIFAAPDGIWVLGSLALDGAGVLDRNQGLRHIEVVGDYSISYPSGAILSNAVAAAAALLQKIGKGVEALDYHRNLQSNQSCPGDGIVDNWGQFKAAVLANMQPSPDPALIRNAAWNAAGFALNPDAAFPRHARERKLGNPVTGEFDFVMNGTRCRGQGFAAGIVWAPVGRWEETDDINW